MSLLERGVITLDLIDFRVFTWGVIFIFKYNMYNLKEIK